MNKMVYKVAVLAGDGIGSEIMVEARKVLDCLDIDIDYTEALVGGAAIDGVGKALPQETIDICKTSDAILFGAVGGPKWETLPPEQQPERGALLPLRKIFDLYANLRPAKIFPPLASASTLRPDIIEGGLDIMIIRELTSGIYFGEPKGLTDDEGFDTLRYKKSEIERIARVGFETARKRGGKMVSIDKANVLSSMVLWRKVVTEVAKDYPDIELTHMYVDNASMQLVRNPRQFDVMLAGNMFGDILSDEASMLTGSIGMLPSASIGNSGFGLYEPVHGSAPDIAGQGKANPLAQIMSAAMMLKYSFERDDLSQKIEEAVLAVLDAGYRTGDIWTEGYKLVTCSEMGDLICDKLKNI